MNLLVTGFGAFGPHDNNPSEYLAQNCGENHAVLRVTFQTVDDFLLNTEAQNCDAWLMIGVHGGAIKHHLETTARNVIGHHPDVEGNIQGPGPIEPTAPQQLSATLWSPENLIETEHRQPSVSAGNYLCNYLFFRGLQTFPNKKIGFLHIPTFNKLSSEIQLNELKKLIESIKQREFETVR